MQLNETNQCGLPMLQCRMSPLCRQSGRLRLLLMRQCGSPGDRLEGESLISTQEGDESKATNVTYVKWLQ